MNMMSRIAAGTALATVPAPALAFARLTDAEILAAWTRRQEAFAKFDGLPDDGRPIIDGWRPGERELWDVIDEAEEVIRTAKAVTPHGAAIQLWCAISHMEMDRSFDGVIQRGDLAALGAREDELDWNARLVFAGLRSLEAMAA